MSRPASSLLLVLLCCAPGLTSCATSPASPPANTDQAMPQSTTTELDFQALVGTLWVAEDIDHAGVIDRLQSRLQIVSLSQLAGHAGCNSYQGPADLGSATALRLGPFATTRMMCAPVVMDQERKFLDALSRARSARAENGLLYLQDAGGVTILRFSRVTS